MHELWFQKVYSFELSTFFWDLKQWRSHTYIPLGTFISLPHFMDHIRTWANCVTHFISVQNYTGSHIYIVLLAYLEVQEAVWGTTDDEYKSHQQFTFLISANAPSQCKSWTHFSKEPGTLHKDSRIVNPFLITILEMGVSWDGHWWIILIMNSRIVNPFLIIILEMGVSWDGHWWIMLTVNSRI
jgi:hypothetical protein